MKWNRFSAGLMIFSFMRNLSVCNAQPDQPQSNGHIPDYDPEFNVMRIYAIHPLLGVAPHEDYGLIPSDDVDERNRLVKLAEGVEGTARTVRVFELYETRNNTEPMATVNGFLSGEANQWILLRKTADSKYDKIRFDNYLRDEDLVILGPADNAQE